jgi:predicted ribosome quality control (RQC) complex YloA/Tae2 family protein
MLHVTRRDALLRPSPARLIAELVGPGSNLILVDDSDRVLGAMFTENSPRRRILPGAVYQPLPKPAPLPPKALLNRFEDVAASPDDEPALSRAVHETYRRLEAEVELDERRTALLSVIHSRQKAARSRRAKLARDLERAQDAESLRRTGELLKIALPNLHKGLSSIVVQDIFEPEAPDVTIQLDPTIAPAENVQRYFKRYKKLKAGREYIEERLRGSKEQLSRLDALAAELEAAPDPGAMSELAERMGAEGISLPEKRRAAAAKAPAAGPRRFISADGLEILVARNRRENHTLTFSIARGNDYWMHLLGREGPHVVIRKPPGKDVPLESLLDAAELAVHYSKIRGADYAEVVYTQRKHVRPIRGGPVGSVTYANVSRLAVRPEEQRLRRVLDTRPAHR